MVDYSIDVRVLAQYFPEVHLRLNGLHKNSETALLASRQVTSETLVFSFY